MERQLAVPRFTGIRKGQGLACRGGKSRVFFLVEESMNAGTKPTGKVNPSKLKLCIGGAPFEPS